ncbi:hypothetical protein DD556_17700 [Phaeobacter sp. JL2872]|nr:hypothetical protein DD556_17700 [Phaeobacter sp. JL2872]
MAHTELDLRERRAIEDMLNAKMPIAKIAERQSRQRKLVLLPLLLDVDLSRFRAVGGRLPHRLQSIPAGNTSHFQVPVFIGGNLKVLLRFSQFSVDI